MYWTLLNKYTNKWLMKKSDGTWTETTDYLSAHRFTSTPSIRNALQTLVDEECWETCLAVGNVRAFVGNSR